MKICTGCKQVKSLEEFHRDSNKIDGRACKCKECVNARKKVLYAADPEKYRVKKRAYYAADPHPRLARQREKYLVNPGVVAERARKRKYGMQPGEYGKLLEVQEGVCAICKLTCSLGKGLSVDHSHATGKVRGLLCHNCNRALGLFKDSVMTLRVAADYLEKS